MCRSVSSGDRRSAARRQRAGKIEAFGHSALDAGGAASALAFAFLKTFAPDVVHTHLNTAARRVGRAAQSLGIPHVATLHIRYDDREHGRCDGLICAATWQRDTIPQGFRGACHNRVGVAAVEIRGALARLLPDEVDALRREWSADARTIVFGSIGRVVAEKGMDVLVDAFRGAFPDANQRVVLVVVGDGLQLEQLGRAAAGDPRFCCSGTGPRSRSSIAHSTSMSARRASSPMD